LDYDDCGGGADPGRVTTAKSNDCIAQTLEANLVNRDWPRCIENGPELRITVK
jgi:hypothetical protein